MKFVKLQLISIIILLAMLSACGGDEMPDNGPMLAAPDLPEATEVTTNSFLLDWEIVEGADAYQIDIATDNAFTSFVAPYENLRRSFSELSVENLDEATTYFVRIRAVAQSVTSENSNIVSVTTMSETNETPDDTTLKGKASFAVGMAVQAGRLSGEHERILLAEFDQITSEFEMKMNIMYPSEGNFDFSRADMTVDWAVANDIEVHGHALIWHNATPSWVENFNGTDAEFEAMVEDYIKTVVTRYKGKVRSWDVVNEAFEDQGGVLRNSVFRRKMGDDYIEKCHRWVREADPEVLIFYNDYNMVFDPIKRGAALGLVKDFQDRGVPVDGFGFQMHIAHDFPSKSLIESTAKEVTDLGLLLHFSELDVRANPNNDLIALTSQRAISQQNKVREVVEVYNAIPEASKFALTVWGLKDDETWLTQFWGHIDWPLLYNADFSKKRAHTGFLEGLD